MRRTGLLYLHDVKQMTHFDIKPLRCSDVQRGNLAKLADVGLAKRLTSTVTITRRLRRTSFVRRARDPNAKGRQPKERHRLVRANDLAGLCRQRGARRLMRIEWIGAGQWLRGDLRSGRRREDGGGALATARWKEWDRSAREALERCGFARDSSYSAQNADGRLASSTLKGGKAERKMMEMEKKMQAMELEAARREAEAERKRSATGRG